MASGNFGDHKPCREGVWELRIDQGAGYRVYYSLISGEIILLLLAGDKRGLKPNRTKTYAKYIY